MAILRLTPSYKDYIWGGEKLRSFGKNPPIHPVAESWEVSCHPDGPSFVEGKPLPEVINPQILGKNCAKFRFFPYLVKFIDSASNLSVQVHPSDEWALRNEGQYGKTEMWHILDAEPGAGLYLGFKKDVAEEEVEKKLRDGTILELLNFYQVKPGETYFIPSGTVHAIGGGVTLCEIQQNSNLTYRLYDYGRLGKDGKPRPLHIEQSLRVLNYKKYEAPKFEKGVIGECEYFSVSLLEKLPDVIKAPKDSFLSLVCLDGVGSLDELSFQKGDSFLLPAGESVKVQGNGRFIRIEVK